ncbi:YdcF family protein [Rhodobacteraceae bacterium N5(2021)]|uniref:YdcF family protein n=1 Tax=Gymnodinialimonas phycosphaerae TaxID=2841589 RepID=A0A975YGZ3_9RHOB|nr:YdcF family protein [Gymnodinialimonas phycosphaerae]MBY4892089.1 YdcF family protein [Gymnodinialimonas phycosphaerae]
MGVRRLGRALRFVLLIYLGTFAAVVVTAYAWPEHSAPARADAIICLGAGSTPNTLTRNSYERAVTCADLFEAGVAPQIAFTGIVAAPLMAEIAVARGVPPEAILVEAESRSTLQNALFTARIVPETARIIVVTDAFHLPRSWVAFRVMGFEDIALDASAMPRLRLMPLLREAVAIWFNAGRIVVWAATPWLPEDARAALLI